MSLFWNRRGILRVVAGEASLAEDTRLRDHLKTCAACRGYYDDLSLVAEAAAPNSVSSATRERARLSAALSGAPAIATPRRRWAPFVLVPVFGAALMALVFGIRTRSDLEPEITWRGAEGTGPQDSSTFALLLYASKKDSNGKAGPLRLVGDFPKAGEATLSMDEYMQFGYRGLDKPAFVYVAGINETGRVNLYVADKTRSPVSPTARPLGESADTRSTHTPGKWRIFAIISETPLSPEQIRAAFGKNGDLSSALPGRRVQAILSVLP